jgi:hypothetical protein
MPQDCWGPNFRELDRERQEYNETAEELAAKMFHLIPEIRTAFGGAVDVGDMQIYVGLKLSESDLSVRTALVVAKRMIWMSIQAGLVQLGGGSDLSVQAQPSQAASVSRSPN